MSMNGNLVVRGGTPETRNELIKHRTADLMEKFLNEAKETKSAIQYTLTSLWSILQTLYVGQHTENFIRAVNLEYYYLGFLNYGCDYRPGGGQDLQMFNFAKSSSPTSPQYECSLAPEGCHSDKDCHRKAVAWCSCRGPSCVTYTDIKLDYNCNGKTTAVINTETDWEWHGCEISHVRCYCKNPSEERTTVWKLDNKRALFRAHYLSLNPNISKGTVEL
ncbi:LOW QUALITY PROTEIN: DELTA-thalatoxin-Avl2a-like [Orbicella faveolata]|uniref:LOW QUALITY PROTEIN: DELTA-thalatoxin-Avl2a-like n=1 Tax=Orbicella faveolata TaxID=48498 RepID=UPI0009E1AB13|nr:LOW QUALITY PROTEIN: DELTA-thalatoxin-Avl2a-like [Orbicella faveolata]